MTVDHLPRWLVDHYAHVDAAELDAYLVDFADDATLRFGSAPEVRGKAAIREALARGHARHQMAHTFINVWTVGPTTICEFAVRYTMHDDGRVFELPSLAILRRREPDRLIDEMRVYIDPTPMG